MADHTVNRYRRAEAIAQVLRQAGADADIAAGFGEPEWRMAAQLSGAPVDTYCPSHSTRALVIELLTHEDRIAAVPLPANPLEGLPQ